MEIVFNDLYRFPIKYASEIYDIKTMGTLLQITFNYTKELSEELENLYKTVVIEDIKILSRSNELVYQTNKYIMCSRIYSTFAVDSSTIMIDFTERID